jgi:hypothetical protein
MVEVLKADRGMRRHLLKYGALQRIGFCHHGVLEIRRPSCCGHTVVWSD